MRNAARIHRREDAVEQLGLLATHEVCDFFGRVASEPANPVPTGFRNGVSGR